jgi:hypothetical protein
MNPQEDLANFGYKLNFKIKVLKHLHFWLPTSTSLYIKVWNFFLKFGQILAFVNLRKQTILALFIFKIAFSARKNRVDKGIKALQNYQFG